MCSRVYIINSKFAKMVGFKHIPQTITGEKAEEILKKLPEKDCQERKRQTQNLCPIFAKLATILYLRIVIL